MATTEPLAELEIDVRCDGTQLIIDNPNVSFDHVQSVKWNFIDVPNDWVPDILFFDDGGFQSGPFESLSQTRDSTIGLGNLGRPGHYEYAAVLRDWRMPRLSTLISTPAMIRQGPALVQVTVDLEARTFRVEPSLCQVQPGETVRWNFLGLDPSSMAEIRFSEFTPQGKQSPQAASNYFGPFESFTRYGQDLEGLGQGEIGKHGYDVHVVSLDPSRRGLLLRSEHSEDPVIDNEEDVSGPLDVRAL